MIIIRNSSPVAILSKPEPCVAAIGFFDGVHKGHRFLINQVKEIASNEGIHSAIITFPVHPRKVINSNYSLEILTTYDEKTKILAETGI
ncbi:Riboflavin biosynthesis protein RibF, partial [termite gut metagenome]